MAAIAATLNIESKLLVLALSVVMFTVSACAEQSNSENIREPDHKVLAVSEPMAAGSAAALKAQPRDNLNHELLTAIQLADPAGIEAFKMPAPGNLSAIPQHVSNPLTREKVALGKLLFHETALAQNGNDPIRAGTWSCASCHHVAAGFKAGVPQGIGEGGRGFGRDGSGRKLAAGIDPHAPPDSPALPDTQPLASPTVLNAAYQEVMLWNGQFGNAPNGINSAVDAAELLAPGTPKQQNARGLPGIETQAIAGLGVHRMNVDARSVLQTNWQYQQLFDQAFPDGSEDVLEDAGKAIAAYERTVLANEAPFQRWLRAKRAAMTDNQKRGAILFFGQAGCVACHRGAALSSVPGAAADAVFFAVGFADFNLSNSRIHGSIGAADRLGRGGFTKVYQDNYKFKVPQLYNLKDTRVLGHGASFKSVRQVIEYKNEALPQNRDALAHLDSRFTTPLGLDRKQIKHLTDFIENALYDPNLRRYVPHRLPSGQCFPVADRKSMIDLRCR